MSTRPPAAIAVAKPVSAVALKLPVVRVKVPPIAAVWVLAMLEMLTVSPALAPTWKATAVNEPSSSLVPLKLVCSDTRWISAFSWVTSAFSASRSVWLLVPFEACTASSRIRWRLLPTSASAPSAVCASEMPSLALRAAWLTPRIWLVKRSEMARPAASSLALLIRRPELRRCSEVASDEPEVDRLRWAFSEAVLVLITCMMTLLGVRVPSA